MRYARLQFANIDPKPFESSQGLFPVGEACLSISLLIIPDVFDGLLVHHGPSAGRIRLGLYPGTRRQANLFDGQVQALGRVFSLGDPDARGHRTTG